MCLFKSLFVLLTVVYTITASADDSSYGDVYVNGHTPRITQTARNAARLNSPPNYTVLDATRYQKNISDSRAKIQQLLAFLQSSDHQDANSRIALIAEQLIDIPFIFSGAAGEGDWQPASSIYQSGAAHIKQDPVYRIDGLNCQTFVQVVMALLYSSNLDNFDQNILKVAYGAAGNPFGETIHYYNRNHFIDGDWNPINRRNGWLTDVTAQGKLSSSATTTSAKITRQNWFLFQQHNLQATVRVLNSADGSSMAQRYMTIYSALNYPHFDFEKVTTAYLPKEKLAIKQRDGSYKPNQILLDKIPTPAVLEIVRDVKKWTLEGQNIKDVVGSEMSISHMGILYRKAFHFGETIYQRTTCQYDIQDKKICSVKPITCQKNQCIELMFLGTSSARPNGYYWYKKPDGNYTCSSNAPNTGTGFTYCNRVVEVPLFDYLTDFQYGSYWYMNNPSIIGVHIEQLSET